MNQRRTTDQRRVSAGDDEGGALDGATNAETLSDTARQRCFARTKCPSEHDQVARDECLAQHLAELVHFFGR